MLYSAHIGLFISTFLMIHVLTVGVVNASEKIRNVFTITNIKVDVTAKTASVARKQALAEGEQEAFELLLKRLTLRIDHQRLPELEVEEISSYVQDFSVLNEKTSQVRYLADVTYRFKPKDIRQLLRDNNIQFAETPSKPILLLIVYEVAGSVALWDNPNPWREAWMKLSQTSKFRGNEKRTVGLVPMNFGNADLTDIATISAELAVKEDKRGLTAIAKRYGTSSTIIIIGSPSLALKEKLILKVRMLRHGDGGRDNEILLEFEGKKDEKIDNLLYRSAKEIKAMVEDHWKKDNLLNFEHSGFINATLPIKSIEEWVNIRNRLAGVAVIENIELVIIAREKVRINIKFIGEIEQLKLSLAQADLLLTSEQGNWIVKLNSRAIAEQD